MKFVTIKDLKKQTTDKRKSCTLAENEIEHDKEISAKKAKAASSSAVNKNVGDELETKKSNDKVIFLIIVELYMQIVCFLVICNLRLLLSSWFRKQLRIMN